MFEPTATGSGESDFVTERSAPVPPPPEPTVVLEVAESLPVLRSFDAVADAVLLITVPLGVPTFTFTTSVNVTLASSASEPMVQFTGPDPPTAGMVQPAEGARDTNVVFAGVESESATPTAEAGPLFSTLIV
jgi:hypothetical protein